MVPLAVGEVGARGALGLVGPVEGKDVCAHVPIAQVDVTVVTFGAAQTPIHGKDPAVGTTSLEPQRHAIGGF